MNVLIVTPFISLLSEQSRPAFIRSALFESGIYNVFTITSNFDHQLKCFVEFKQTEKISTVKTLPYKNNKSIFRFLSHLILSIKLSYQAFTLRESVDVYYVTAPFAIVSLIIKVLTRKKVIVDIVDLWPGSLPFNINFVNFIPCKIWSFINYYSIRRADRVISLSSSFLKDANIEVKNNQILLGSSSDFATNFTDKLSEIRVLYIGNIGSLYDFKTLVAACRNLKKDNRIITLEIIGDGDCRNSLISDLEEVGIQFTYHGVVYDNDILKGIISKCDFGFNGYLNTNASFSYKASTYFKFGIPIINSMNGDLNVFVDSFKIGFNYRGGDVNSLTTCLLECVNIGMADMELLRSNVRDFFLRNLSKEVVSSKIIEVFDELCNEKII